MVLGTASATILVGNIDRTVFSVESEIVHIDIQNLRSNSSLLQALGRYAVHVRAVKTLGKRSRAIEFSDIKYIDMNHLHRSDFSMVTVTGDMIDSVRPMTTI